MGRSVCISNMTCLDESMFSRWVLSNSWVTLVSWIQRAARIVVGDLVRVLSWSWVSFETVAGMEGFLEWSYWHSNGSLKTVVVLVG
jgi:hypothetical protein